MSYLLLRRACRALPALALALAASAAWGQSALPEDAAAALRAGQMAAAEAIATYEAHYPDQPLWREAIAQGERARELAPDRVEPLRFLAQVYGVTGWTSRTWEAWQAYLDAGGTLDARSRADAARAALVLGYQAFTAGAMGRARDLLEASYELEPDDLTTVTYLGQARLELGDAEGAIPLLALAADTYPQLRPMLQRAELGAAHGQRTADAFLAAEREFAQGNMSGALSLYVAAIQGDPGFVEAVKGAAEVNAAIGRADEARRLWERALQLDPDDAEVAAIIARLDAAAAAQAAAVAAEAAQEALAAAEAEAEAQAAAEAEAPPVVLAPPGGQPPAAAPPEEPGPQAPPVAEDPAGQPPVAEGPAQEPAEEPPVAEEPEQPPVAEEPEPEEPPVAEEPERPEPPPVAEPPAQAPPVAEPPTPAAPEAAAVVPPAPQPAPTGGPTLSLVDVTLTPRPVEAGGEGAFTFLEAPAGAVGDLAAYRQGTLHVRVEMLDKPTDDPVLVQVCLVPDDLITVRPACSEPSELRLSGEGVASASQAVGALDGAADIDWSQGMAQVLVVLRDAEGRPLDPRYAYDEQGRPLDVAAYYPMSMHVRAALVPAGGSFPGW